MKVVRYNIKKLFKTYSHEIYLDDNERIRIILGQNGIGKTAMLKLMNAFFSYNIDEMQKYYFEQLEFVMDDGRVILIEHEPLDVRVTMKKRANKQSVLFSEIRDDTERASMRMRSILSKESFRRLEDNYWQNRYTEEIYSSEVMINLYKDEYPQLSDINIHGYPEWLDEVVKNVDVEMIDTKRLHSKVNAGRAGLSRVSWQVGDTVKVYANDFKKQLRRARAEASKVAAELDRTYPSRLIESFEKYTDQQTIAQLKKNLRLLNSKRESLMKVGLMDSAKDEVLSRSFALNDKISVALNIYLEDSTKKLEAYDEMVKKVNLLIELINNRFLDKCISVEGADGLVIRSLITNESIDMNGLSSGEQHLFVLYYYMLFMYRHDTLLLLDEPEISLHITWQKKFISDLMRIMELNPMNILIATHAPSIVRDYWSVTQELKPTEY